MANYTYHYFGAYLEIEVQRVSRKHLVRECENGHTASGPHCNQCGAKVSEKFTTRLEYPNKIVDDLLPLEYEDVLSEITPPQLYGTGVIIARDNGLIDNSADMWLHLSPWVGEREDFSFVQQFPTKEQIGAMIDSLQQEHAEIIALLRKHPAVLSVEVKAGYVYCPEY